MIRIDASQAPVRIEGRVDADGNGLQHRFDFEDTGGAGAGGSVYLTAKSLAGAGAISADGGGYCPACINGFGGMGGGGGGDQGSSSGGNPAAPDRRAPRLSRLALHGRTLGVLVSEPGTVTVKLARCTVRRSRRHGRLVKRKCRPVRTITVRAKRAGALRIRLPRGLPAGGYRVTVAAGDRDGNRSRLLVRTITLHRQARHRPLTPPPSGRLAGGGRRGR